jgi:hypothetical protein
MYSRHPASGYWLTYFSSSSRNKQLPNNGLNIVREHIEIASGD